MLSIYYKFENEDVKKMNSKLIIRDALNQYKENELIFASKLYKATTTATTQ